MKRQCLFSTKELPPRIKKLVNLNRGRDDRPGRPIDTFPVQGSKIAIGRWGPSPLPGFKLEHSSILLPSATPIPIRKNPIYLDINS